MMKFIRNQKGFTLLEMLVSTAVFTIILFAVYTMLTGNQATYARGENRVEIQQNARVAMRRMIREIRMVGYDPSSAIPAQASQTAVQIANANTITFIADLDGDNDADNIPDTDWVRYQLQGSQLIRESSSWVGGAWTPPINNPNSSVLADAVTALNFTYFDGNDPNNEIAAPVPAASLTAIRRITVDITGQEAAASFQDAFPLTADVRLRNP